MHLWFCLLNDKKTHKKPKQKNPNNNNNNKKPHTITTTVKQTKNLNTKKRKKGSCFGVILTLNISVPALLLFVSMELFFYLHRCVFLHCYQVLFKHLLPKTAVWSNYCYSYHYMCLGVNIDTVWTLIQFLEVPGVLESVYVTVPVLRSGHTKQTGFHVGLAAKIC